MKTATKKTIFNCLGFFLIFNTFGVLLAVSAGLDLAEKYKSSFWTMFGWAYLVSMLVVFGIGGGFWLVFHDWD